VELAAGELGAEIVADVAFDAQRAAVHAAADAVAARQVAFEQQGRHLARARHDVEEFAQRQRLVAMPQRAPGELGGALPSRDGRGETGELQAEGRLGAQGQTEGGAHGAPSPASSRRRWKW
jgi:hypothetical protein